MRIDRSSVYRLRAAFGLGFVVLGLVTLWRVATAPGPSNSKIIGGALALALMGLGIGRLVQYQRMRASGKS
jgi:hypothetical protein